MTLDYPLPQDTRQKFTNNPRCSNLSLLLDRYVGYNGKWNFEEKQKATFFKQIAQNFQMPQSFIQAYYKRWQIITQSLPHTQTFTAAPEWRMVVGLGQSSILETSMVLDRITGIPIIPGSSLKGLAASYALLCILGKTDRDKDVEREYQRFLKKDIPELPEHFESFIQIFGYQGEVGKVIFLDAVPTKTPTLEPDIMNNHHQEYYGDKTGNTSPAPWDSPIPVYFLTLGRESEFAFAVAGRDNKEDTQYLVNQAAQWLKAGLSELGIGAKTTAGYGYMPIE